MSNDSGPLDQAKGLAEIRDEPSTYVHEPAGIRERSGAIPTWLTAVSVGLVLWGVYYAIRYWSSD